MTVAHHHADVSGGWLRAGVFGAMDGLVTNIALVAGVGGGGADRGTIILTGTAGLVAGAFSMALGEFAWVDTQNDAVAHEVRVERAEIDRHPEDEMAELAEQMGLPRAAAEAVAREVHVDAELAVKVHSRRSSASTRTTSRHRGRPRSARSWRSRSADLPAGLLPARLGVAGPGAGDRCGRVVRGGRDHVPV